MDRSLLLLLIACAGFGLGADGCTAPAPPASLPPETLSGELRGVVPPPGSPFRSIGASAIGRFQLQSAGGDVRSNPGTAILETPTGRIVATAVRTNEVRNVDPDSGWPRVAGAADPCPTGAEASCWSLGDATDQNRAAFDALCGWLGVLAVPGALGSLLPSSSCLLELFNEPTPIPIGTTVGEILAQQLANGDRCNAGGGFCVLLNGLLGKGTPANDPATAVVPLHPGLSDGATLSLVDGLSGYLAPEQQALFGCGPLFGRHCDVDGIEPFHAEAAALFRADALAATGEGAPRREVSGVGPVALPGGRDPFSYFADPVGHRWHPGRDGCVVGLTDLDADVAGQGTALRNDLLISGLTAAEADQCDDDPNPSGGTGYRVPVPDALTPLGPLAYFDQTGIEFTVPEVEAAFPTEIAIVSENLARLFDGLTAAIAPGCDPATGCGLAGLFVSVTTVELADDPSGLPRFRWLWETGAEYVVTEATGDLAGFLGWTLHGFGPEVSRAGGDFGVAFLLADPSGAIAAPASSLSWAGAAVTGAAAYGVPGADGDGDGVPDVADDCIDVANGPGDAVGDQVDVDGDGIGNACDCDFDGDGACNVDDFTLFLPAFVSGSDPGGVGFDMDADGAVTIDDFGLFLPGFLLGAPGPAAPPF